MPQMIPVTNDAQQTLVASNLNGQNIRIDMWYQDTGNTGWFISLFQTDGTPIVQSAKLNTSVPVLVGLVVDFMGDIIPVATTSPQQELSRNPWEITHQLIFVTPAEFEGSGLAPV